MKKWIIMLGTARIITTYSVPKPSTMPLLLPAMAMPRGMPIMAETNQLMKLSRSE